MYSSIYGTDLAFWLYTQEHNDSGNKEPVLHMENAVGEYDCKRAEVVTRELE